MMASKEADDAPLADYLDEDPVIRRQKFVCMSILTPSDVDVRNRAYFEARAFALDQHKEAYPNKEAYDTALADWCSTRQTDLDDDFQAQAEGKPHIPIVKVRGSYKTQTEANERSRFLAKTDKTCDIWVAEVGRWVPADGKRREDETAVEYTEQTMQALMKKRKESQELARQEFERRKNEAVRRANRTVMEGADVATAS